MVIASVLGEIAGFAGALLSVYSLCLILWIILTFLFVLGLRMPYHRWLNAVIDFLRDVSEPYLNIFRKIGSRAGPFDLSPLIAILVLNLAGGLAVAALRHAA